jgi:uncharacterized protein (TIGR02147 family)
MQASHKVFAFSDPIDYLKYRFEERRRKDPKFSLSGWARQLGYENSSLLSQVLKRERSLKMNLVSKLSGDLKLKGKALKYFECIALNESCKTDTEKKMVLGLARQMRPKKFRGLENISLEVFSAVADWYHWAILEMTHLEGFSEDADQIHRRLGGKVPKKTIKAALRRLLEIGLLTRGESGRVVRASVDIENAIFMRNKIPCEAIQSYHRQMIDQARIAIGEQTIEERYLRGTTLPMKKANLEKANEIIRTAHKQLLELSEKSGADEVYQLNSQFFKLTT